MKQFVVILVMCTCLVLGCNSNKKSSKGNHRKRGNYTSSASGSSGKSTSADSLVVMKTKKRAYGTGRPKIRDGGAVGVGTGGSYASNAYKRDILNQNNARREYFKKRMEENDRLYYGEEVREEIPVDSVMTDLAQQDSVMTDSTMQEFEVEENQIQADSATFSLDK